MLSTPVCVEPGSFLTLHYRLAGPAGDVINTFGGKPATLTLGSGELSPAVEACLIGLSEGARASFALPAGAAFGDRNPAMLQWLARKEGILAALESSHAVAWLLANPGRFQKDHSVILNLSGRGDKDLAHVGQALRERQQGAA